MFNEQLCKPLSDWWIQIQIADYLPYLNDSGRDRWFTTHVLGIWHLSIDINRGFSTLVCDIERNYSIIWMKHSLSWVF